MSRNRKQWTLSLNDELETKILNYKKAYNLSGLTHFYVKTV